jgi:hypothetical protein
MPWSNDIPQCGLRGLPCSDLPKQQAAMLEPFQSSNATVACDLSQYHGSISAIAFRMDPTESFVIKTLQFLSPPCRLHFLLTATRIAPQCCSVACAWHPTGLLHSEILTSFTHNIHKDCDKECSRISSGSNVSQLYSVASLLQSNTFFRPPFATIFVV